MCTTLSPSDPQTTGDQASQLKGDSTGSKSVRAPTTD
jgi:hypothetical protein